MKQAYKIEITRSSWRFPEEYTTFDTLDNLVQYLSRYAKSVSIYISDNKDNDIASREFGTWHLTN